MTPEQEMEMQALRTENFLLKKSYEQLSIQNANMSDRMQASGFAQARMDRLDRNLATVIDAISATHSQLTSFSEHFEGRFRKILREVRATTALSKTNVKAKSRPASRKKK